MQIALQMSANDEMQIPTVNSRLYSAAQTELGHLAVNKVHYMMQELSSIRLRGKNNGHTGSLVN